jgi:hypothetical protein
VIVRFVDVSVIVDHHFFSPKESLKSDGQQLHYHQQNKQSPLT